LGGEDFDLDDFALPPEPIAEGGKVRAGVQPRLHKTKTGFFVKLPYERMLEVSGWRDAGTAIMVELAWQAFKTHKHSVLLSNAALRSVGVSADAKVRALRRLEAAGLIAVNWRGGKKTPLVTLLWTR
jgi:hypothetical protein